MKNVFILLFSIFFANILCAQEQKAIRITKENKQREVVLKENKRIFIKTVDGKELSGRYSVENSSIVIDDEKIALADIKYLKRNPAFTSILTTVLFVYGGSVATIMGVALGILVDPNIFYLTIPGVGLIYAGLQKPNFHRKFKAEKNWMFEIVTIPE
ncbi:hypothetical protein SAMN05661096_00872 [Marivirga sericea]|uniref:Positive regulator of sigma(E), RseC/MucC n=1 Tax=Marivirga sericea TaxID=1028 RepID=A0A1X7INJ1_9BACT|nr:hypothetical protein [Marivirga sericea]SMG16579.1 hypothetical protein SAMN05661096_00872 [Marivirga sericea]